MKVLSIIAYIYVAVIVISCTNSQASINVGNEKKEIYKCLPCGYECDKEVYNQPGKCPHCQMQLVNASTITFKTLDPSKICTYIKTHPKVVLLDVRSNVEFEGKASPNYGTIKNAINIPVDELESKLSSINPLKNSEILVYCSHSHRSPRASYILTQHGFKNVTNMNGGMSVVTDTTCKK